MKCQFSKSRRRGFLFQSDRTFDLVGTKLHPAVPLNELAILIENTDFFGQVFQLQLKLIAPIYYGYKLGCHQCFLDQDATDKVKRN